ncbi:Gfo/Idh/MocA family protein [Streptomyces sp. NEAU-W12]|uniref:Gfo/Idh/MocA family protein n=1 Tax=Streptomyces sp. NEAU-W12 TaxID=2994668 RepID=UPI00224B2777|nr:Gfo/Idh/MocA family oxidoreductase [Streptomyces sp. NEAU-W12]
MRTGVAIVGCGFVSDFYLRKLTDHPELVLTGVHDRIAGRSAAVGEHQGVEVYETLSDLLSDDRVHIVVNLTNPSSHAEVTLTALAAGRHVYSEKPLATSIADGKRIVAEAERRDLLVACAPANILGEAFQTLWREVRNGTIGVPRLVHAELDDGAVHLMGYQDWHNTTGSPWPYREEFGAGCTVEHAAYHLAPLTAMLGPVRQVVADHATLMPDKFPPGETGVVGPDFVTASLSFEGGTLTRLTCSVVAPPDRSLTVVGDGGVLRLDNCWDFGSPVTVRTIAGRRSDYLREAREVEHARPYLHHERYLANHRMDFPRGIAELAAAVGGQRVPRLSARHALHVLEVTLAMTSTTGVTAIASEFDQPEPLPWAS